MEKRRGYGVGQNNDGTSLQGFIGSGLEQTLTQISPQSTALCSGCCDERNDFVKCLANTVIACLFQAKFEFLPQCANCRRL